LWPCEKQTDPIRLDSPRNWTRTMIDTLVDTPDHTLQEVQEVQEGDPLRYA
jgi:hypothetical protein